MSYHHTDASREVDPYTLELLAQPEPRDIQNTTDGGHYEAAEPDPPPCGHSACRQNWIDTGSQKCVRRESGDEEGN